ncbi:magnesium transporter [Flavobacteriaceae bacterium Ap0902]|nr:magnesium transporter [Flavobacteriaceae bacterium Ap0902]
MSDWSIDKVLRELEVPLEERNPKMTLEILEHLHNADIAELFDEIYLEDQLFILSVLDNEDSAAVLLELEEEDRRKLLQNLSSKQIAEEVIDELESDDAADVLSELEEDKKQEVISEILDEEHAKDIVDLLRYDEDTAGGLMGKELVKVNANWSVIRAVKEMRKQAEDMEEVYSIYVVDDHDKLLGTLSLKSLLTTSSRTQIADVFNPKFHYVAINDTAEDVANDIQKYDRFEMPVLDERGTLVGHITMDDVLDFIRDEAEKDYQLASGISEDVDMHDSIWDLTKARLPWLLIGVVGSLISSRILDGNLTAMNKIPMLILFIPLIAATAGNMGVQSSAIVVQALAMGNMRGSMWSNLLREISMGIISGVALSVILFGFSYILYGDLWAGLTISISLFSVVLVAAIIGTLIPLILEKRGINPAIATGPFITTSNDVLGISIYFLVARMILDI